jgi:hypothetical protein
MIKRALRHEFLLRAVVLLVAFAALLVYGMQQTNQVSISDFWSTPLQPLFIFVNAATSYYFFSTEKWQPSAIFLLLLTAFPVDNYMVLHNIFATSFFVYSAIPIATDKRLNIYLGPYVLSLAFVNWPDIFFSEVIAVSTLCLFQGHKLYLRYKVHRIRKELKDK